MWGMPQAGLTDLRGRPGALRSARRQGARPPGRVDWDNPRDDSMALAGPMLLGPLTSVRKAPRADPHASGSGLALQASARVALQIGGDGGLCGYAAAVELAALGDAIDRSDRPGVDGGHRALALGPRRPRLSAVDGRLIVNECVRDGGFLEGGYSDLVSQLQAALAARGAPLAPGDWLLTGPVAGAVVALGDHVVGEFGALGHAAITID